MERDEWDHNHYNDTSESGQHGRRLFEKQCSQRYLMSTDELLSYHVCQYVLHCLMIVFRISTIVDVAHNIAFMSGDVPFMILINETLE